MTSGGYVGLSIATLLSQHHKVTAVDVVQLTAQSYGINAEEQEGILKYLIEGGDLSLYGLSNAVTRASQDVVSYDRATTLEGIGWQVATMEPQQWKQINQ